MKRKLLYFWYSLFSTDSLMNKSCTVNEYRNIIIADIFIKRFPDEAEWEAYCEDFHLRNSGPVEIWNKENNAEYEVDVMDFNFN